MSKAQCRAIHDTMFRGKPIIPLSVDIYENFFEGCDEHWYYTREEFGDGSCFFHSLATLLNLNDDHASDGGDPKQAQKQIIRRIAKQMKLKCEDTDNIASCFNFMHKDYTSLPERKQKVLGHKLRKLILDAVDTKWDSFWKKKTGGSLELINRVHDASSAKEMLKKTSVWADVYLILFAMHVLHLNILFFDDSSGSIYCGVHGENMRKQPTIFILWVNKSHFQPILRLTCERGKHKIKGIFRFGEDAIVRHVFNKWRHQEFCPAVPLTQVLL